MMYIIYLIVESKPLHYSCFKKINLSSNIILSLPINVLFAYANFTKREERFSYMYLPLYQQQKVMSVLIAIHFEQNWTDYAYFNALEQTAVTNIANSILSCNAVRAAFKQNKALNQRR